MVRLGGLLRRSPRDNEPKPEKEPARRAPDSPPIIVMIPDVAGVSSFRIYSYPDAPGAVRFLTSLSRQQRERAHAFWALQHEPGDDTLENEDAGGEAMVLIRSSEGSDLVYIVSFLDIESAQSFARFEVKRGMHLGLILVYWASMVNVVLNDDGVQLIPEVPPRIDKRRQRAATSTVAAPRLPSLAQTTEAEDLQPAPQISNGVQGPLAETEEGQPEAEAEDQRRSLEAEAAEQRQLAADAEERRRLEAEAAEQRRLEAEAAEQARLEAEAEQKRLEAQAEQQGRLEAEAGQRRLEAEAEQKRLEAEAEAQQRRLEAEAQQRRLEAEAEEQRRLEAEVGEQRRLEADAEEQRRLEAEAEQRRLEAEEEERRLQVEAEQRRLEAEAEEQRRLEAESEQRRLEAEAQEQGRLAAEAEQRRLEAEAAEQRRLEAEWAMTRVAADAEAEERRMAAEIEEQQRLEAEAQRRLEAEAEDQRLFEAQKRAVFAAQADLETAGLSEPPDTQADAPNPVTRPSFEPSNPIEELIRQDAASRVDVPSEFARKPRDNAPEATDAEEDDETVGIADDVGKILRKRRWEKRESPFEGFKSPPGRF